MFVKRLKISMISKVSVLPVLLMESTLLKWHNNRVQCDNGGVDEKYCTEEKEDHEEMFQCQIFGNISISRVCDRKCDCLNCDDEFNCNGYTYQYWYKCYNSSDVIHSYNICNNIKDCKHGDDESICGNVTTCVTESRSPRPYMLANYSRCTPWVWCDNKLDHTNCSNNTPLQCPVRDYTSTVSQYVVC